MHHKKIKEHITTLKGYQHICQLQLQKAQGGHDFSDLLKHYHQKIETYETQIVSLEKAYAKAIKRRMLMGVGVAHIAVIGVVWMLWI